jgi:ribonuclease HI
VPLQKALDITKAARSVLGANKVTARSLARITGKLTAASPAMTLAKKYRLSLQRDITLSLAKSQSWDAPLTLSTQSKKDLRTISSIQRLKKIITSRLVIGHPDNTLITDASPIGWGAILQTGDREYQVQGRWLTTEHHQSSNWKETRAITLAYLAFRRMIPQNTHLHVRTDSTTALAYIRKQGGHLLSLTSAIEPFVLSTISRHITVTSSHIPGKDNTKSDHLSRKIPKDHDWSVHPSDYAMMIQTLNIAPTVDLFADRSNAKIKKYVSWRLDPHSIGKDFRSISLQGMTTYACPPFPLIRKFIAKAMHTPPPFQCLIVTPHWKGTIWWPLLMSLRMSEPIQLQHPPELGPSNYHPMRDRQFPPLIGTLIGKTL